MAAVLMKMLNAAAAAMVLDRFMIVPPTSRRVAIDFACKPAPEYREGWLRLASDGLRCASIRCG